MSIETIYHDHHFAATELCDQVRGRLYEMQPDDEQIRASHVHHMHRIIMAIAAVMEIMEERPCGSDSASDSASGWDTVPGSSGWD